MSERKARARAFVPKMTVRRAVASVLPACALAAATELLACEPKQQVIALAVMAFDAGVDPASSSSSSSTSSPPLPPPHPVVIALAVMAFDAGLDRPSSDADAGAKGSKRRPLPQH